MTLPRHKRSSTSPERQRRATEARRWRSGLVIVCALLLLVSLSPCLLVTLSPCRGSAEDREELPTFRRLLLPPDQLSRELKRVQDGVLVRLPVAEFDTLVERATRGGARQVRPRLLEARYHGVLKEEALIGDGQWKVLHEGPTPGLLNLEPFNLALRQARFENENALIAAFDGKTPALLVETAGERTVSLDWSARAEAGPEGLQFRLEVPPCPVALLELDVPAGRAVTLLGASDDSLLLSGPHAAESADLRRWKIVGRGRDKIDFRVRPADRSGQDGDPSPAPFVVQKTTQKLYPEGLDATFELTLEGLSRGVRELVCECDPVLRPRDVVGPHVDGWSFQGGDGKKPSRLTIRLREPVHAGTWQIVCLAPLSATPVPAGPSRRITWRSPGLRLIGGTPRGETLKLWLHPDLRVESWNPGGFRLRSIGKADTERPAGMQQLTLEGGGLGAEGPAANAPPRRPEARLQAYGVEFRAWQLAWWRCDDSGMTLTAQIGWEVSQGQLFQLPVQLPPGWTVERVEMSPDGLLRDSRVRNAGGRATLYVDLRAPLGPRTTGERVPTLTVHLRPAWSGPITGRPPLPFPDLVPVGARFREGALAVDGDEKLFTLVVQTKAERSEPEGKGPWGEHLPEYYYRYRGQPLSGTLVVRPRPPRLRAWCGNEVLVASGQAAVKTHLRLEAEVGSPESVELSLSASDGEAWQWQTEPGPRGEDTAGGNSVRRAERLYDAETADCLRVLAACNPLQAAGLLAARPSGERWRLTFARPLRARETIRLQATRHLHPRDNRWQVPLPVVLSPGRMEGEVTLHLARGDLVQMQTVGLSEAAPAVANGVAPWRTFRYGQNEVALTLSGQALAADRAAVAAIDRARLVTCAGESGFLQHHFSFRVANWGQRTLPLRLPPGSRPLAVQVDGRWLPRLVPAAPADEGSEPEELALPVPGRGETLPAESVHHYEIVYTRAAPAWSLWQKLDAPAPVLPVQPLAFRRVWRLAPNLMPLRDGRCQLVPGTHGDGSMPTLPRHAADLFRLPGGRPAMGTLLHDGQMSAGEALTRAVEDLCGRWANREVSLREVVGDIAFVNLRDRYHLVIDAVALRDAGITPDTKLTVPPLSAGVATTPWAECGLVAVPARSVVLLTTTSGRGAALRESLSDSLEQTLAAAAAEGQDSSGRFRSALSWLRPRSAPAATPQPRLPGLEVERIDWGEWEPVASLPDDTLIVVRRDVVTESGFALALLLALFFWMFRRRSVRARLTALLLVLALTGLGLVWLPSSLRDLAWFPLLAACAGALVWYLKAVTRGAGNAKPSLRKLGNTAGAVTAGVLLLAVLDWGGRAAPPAPATVYLVPGPAGDSENQTVLVPADFLDRLKALSRPTPLATEGPRAVLLAATYDGKLVENQAEFTAVFSVHCLDDGPATLAVPLDGVRLVGDDLRRRLDVWLDGAHADPLALPAPRAGYSLKVSGQGRHKVEMRFRVPVTGTPEDRNVLFTVPPLVQSRLTWHAPAGASDTQVLVKQGAQRIVHDGGGERLEADLGRLPKTDQGDLPRPVHLHWYQPAQAGRPPRVQYQAAYLWDLNLEASSLTAWLRYRVLQGAVKTLEVDLPAELVVRSASAQRTRSPSKPPPPWLTHFRLRDWHVVAADGKRTLRLEFPYPITGDFQVTLELAPREALPSAVTLPLPSPRGERADELHYLAYRTQPGLNAQRDTPQNITRIPEKEFAPDWPGVPRLDASSSGAAYKISPGGMPVLRLHLRRGPPVVEANLVVTIQTGMQLAEVRITADLEAENKDLAAVEWDLQSPRLTIASVSGDDVRAWKQTGQRVLVWLNRTTKTTHLSLSGWLPLERWKDRSHLKLSGPLVIAARQRQHTRLQLAAAADLALASVQTSNLQPIAPSPSGKADDRERTFETRESSPSSLECDVQPAANAVAQVLTFAEVADRQLRFTTTVDYKINHGELGRVQVRLRNWEAEQVELQAERVALRRGPARTLGGRSWQLTLQPGVTGRYRLTLRGSMPVEGAAVGVPMPEVTVQGVESSQYKLAVAGDELAVEARSGLDRLNNPAKELAPWPGAAERVERTRGQAWRVQGPEWQLRLLPRARALEAAPVRIFLLEQSAAVMDGRHWMHEARCWLRHEAHTDLNVDFPAPARVVAAVVDGVEVTPLQPDSARLWLPLPGRAGVRCVRLRWLYEEAESLDRPNLASPRVVDAIEGPALWTVLVPAGWDAARNTAAHSLGTGATREGALALHRAEAQLRICQELCRQERDAATSAPLAAAQRRFARYCRHARHALDAGGNFAGVTGPEGRTLADWLDKLQADNRLLANQNGFDALVENPKSEKEVSDSDFGFRASDLRDDGTPISWQAQPGEGPPLLHLTARYHQQTRQALAASGQWLGVLVVVWLLSFVPLLLPRLRLFWPEQIALLGIIGWYLAGWTLVVLLLLLVAVCGRIFLLARGVRSLFRGRKKQPSTMTAGSGMIPP